MGVLFVGATPFTSHVDRNSVLVSFAPSFPYECSSFRRCLVSDSIFFFSAANRSHWATRSATPSSSSSSESESDHSSPTYSSNSFESSSLDSGSGSA